MKIKSPLIKKIAAILQALVPVMLALLLVATSSLPTFAAKSVHKEAPPESDVIAIPTNKWAVQVQPGSDPDQLAQSMGAENLGPVGTLENTYLFHIPGSEEVSAAAEMFATDSKVVWFEQQVAYQRVKREVTDPLFPSQWHLSNTGQSGGTSGQDINVVPAWDAGYTGNGVNIAVVDDGLQHTHPDISPNYNSAFSWDFIGDDGDPTPASTDGHGTSVAGVAAASADGSSCGVGAAYNAGLAGLRLIPDDGLTVDADEADALTYDYGNNHIYNNGWGSPDSGTLAGPGALAQTAIEDGIANGRSGKGSIYVWAAGNGQLLNDNVNYDGYANSRFTIAVGAVDNKGEQASYSEPGAALLVTAPSSGSTAGIPTTDLLGADGYSTGDCTSETSGFGGTSSSAALVSGVVALMLEANPNLGWRDVQHILVETAVKNHPGDPGWAVNGGGFNINHKYGFGRIDASAAVNLAKDWTNVGDVYTVNVAKAVGLPIPDNNATGVTSSINISEEFMLEHVEVVFTATHPYRGDLEVVLTSPSGTQSVLALKRTIDANDNYDSWKFMTVLNWGEYSAGNWTLQVSDKALNDIGTFVSWELNLYGRDVYTQETLTSVPLEDGWVLESSSGSKQGGSINKYNAYLRIGDNALSRQYRSILSFDTSSIPDDAEIVSVIFQFKYAATKGKLNHGNMLVDIRKGGFSNNNSLQKVDFQAKASQGKILIFKVSEKDVDGWYSQRLLLDHLQYVNPDGVTQLRLRFNKAATLNFKADFMSIFSGNDANVDNHPRLIITYFVPSP